MEYQNCEKMKILMDLETDLRCENETHNITENEILNIINKIFKGDNNE